MKKYHILFNKTGHDFYSTGENFESESPMEAYVDFRKRYPNAVFIELRDLDALNALRINRTSIQDMVDKDEHYKKDSL